MRSIALPSPVVDALRSHRARQVRHRVAVGQDWAGTFAELGGLVFCTATGTPLERRNVRRSFRSLCVAAGIEGEWTTYHLRHTAVSLLSDAGVPPEQIADLLGHRDTRMVLLTYRHPVLPVVDGGSAAMGGIFATGIAAER